MKKCFIFKVPAFVVHTHYMSICFSNTVLILLSRQELDKEFLVLHTKNPKQLCYCIEKKDQKILHILANHQTKRFHIYFKTDAFAFVFYVGALIILCVLRSPVKIVCVRNLITL